MVKTKVIVTRSRDGIVRFEREGQPLESDVPTAALEDLKEGPLEVMCVMAGSGLRVTRLPVPESVSAAIVAAHPVKDAMQIVELVSTLSREVHQLPVSILSPFVRALAALGQQEAAVEIFSWLLEDDFVAHATHGELALEAYASLVDPPRALGAALVRSVWAVRQLRSWDSAVAERTMDEPPKLGACVPFDAWPDDRLVEYGNELARIVYRSWPALRFVDHFRALYAELSRRPEVDIPVSISECESLLRLTDTWGAAGYLRDGIARREEVEAIFGVELSPSLWGAMATAPSAIETLDTMIHGALLAKTEQLDFARGTGRFFPLLPFAKAEGKSKNRLIALDLRASVGVDSPIVSFPAAGAEGRIKKEAENVGAWLEKANAKLAKEDAVADDRRRQQMATDVLSNEDKDRLLALEELVRRKGLKMNTTISSSELETFEEQNRIRLPATYREFLLRIGNGGEGPGGVRLRPLPSSASKAHRAFPLHEEIPDLTEEHWNRMHDGVIELIDHLDTDTREPFSLYLVVTGKSRGQVWTLDPSMDVARPPSAHAGFLDWCIAWLEREDLALSFE